MKITRVNPARALATGLLLLAGLAPASPVLAQQRDPLAEELREAEAERDAALRQLDARRAEYLDALRKAERIERRHALRPPLANPYAFPGADPIAEAEAPWARPYGVGPRPYVLRPLPRSGGPIGPGGYGYGPAWAAPVGPYGYGYGPARGLDIPFGFGLGGLSIRW